VHLSQVVEHGLRHLAWLVREDESINQALAAWSEVLSVFTHLNRSARSVAKPGPEAAHPGRSSC
jgi:hypothetical protein